MLRIPQCLDSRLTDGGTGRTLLPRNIIFLLLVLISVLEAKTLRSVAQCLNHYRIARPRALREMSRN
jgi:hypothetical protein